jgi:hypothetical protein
MPERILHRAADAALGARLVRPDLLRLAAGKPDATAVPTWTPEQIPQRPLLPVYDETRSLLVEGAPSLPRVAVNRDVFGDILWIAPDALTLTDFTLTVRRLVRPDGAVAVSGGSAVLSVSVYLGGGHRASAGSRTLAAVMNEVRDSRSPFGDIGDAPAPAVQPAPLSGLTVELRLPAGVASEPPSITVSPLAGAATIAVELTEAGVLAWQSALQEGEGRTIPGTLHASASVPTVNSANPFGDIDTRRLDTPLGTVLAARGAADIREIDPQQTLSATLVVVGSQLVTGSTVALRPSGGQVPTSAVFGPQGGRTDVTVVTQHPETSAVDWRAEVAFTPTRWPIVPASGRLDRASGWITIVKPESWCVGYLLAVIPVDGAGRAVPAASRAGDRVQGVLNFTAPYVTTGLLSTAFEAEYSRPTSFVLPRYPNQPFGDLVLTVFATCGGTAGQATRRLGADDVVVTALVHPDGHVELHTETDSLPEASFGLTTFLTRLSALAHA